MICFPTQLAKFSADSDERLSVNSSFQESIAAANADQMLILNDKLDQKVKRCSILYFRPWPGWFEPQLRVERHRVLEHVGEYLVTLVFSADVDM